MKERVKIMLCAVMTVTAALCLLAVLADMGVLDADAQTAAEYLLREQDGYVAVVHCGEETQSVTLTEIRVATLPLSDRRALAAGMELRDTEELLERLEDLGS